MITIKVLCLDQATVISGYSVFDNGVLKKYGILQVKNDKTPVFDRMKEMADMIENLIDDYQPDYIAIENTQLQFGNVDVFRTLSQFQGVLIKMFLDKSIGFTIVNPSEWRKVCGIKGKARIEQKLNTQLFIKENYGLELTQDESDAVGIGVWAIKNITKE